jgi:hypothetical protein
MQTGEAPTGGAKNVVYTEVDYPNIHEINDFIVLRGQLEKR